MKLLLDAPLLWGGSTLLLSSLAPLRCPSLVDRLQPYLAPTPAALSVDRPLRQRLAPISLLAGDRLGRLTGRTEPLERRLRRAHSTLDPASFRFGQLSHATLALGLAGTLVALLPRGKIGRAHV